MLGTFGGALEARQIDASDGRLTAHVRGEIETDDGVLVLKRIHVSLRLQGAKDRQEIIERVHDTYAARCPVSRSLRGCIEITSSVELV